MKKIKVRVFPDYMSTGLWNEGGANMDTTEVAEQLSESIMMALLYWCEIWEFFIEVNPHTNNGRGCSESYYKRWYEDGKRLVSLMNDFQDKYEFVYEVEQP